ncbi:hypothetical protein RchiOBHm_Chr1g0337421 [Rosa chinensis]|uniref:Uncharacterized protein n=1 Tax=Rosa chinensis TaxID=74649 RepID=A0A2P6SCX9_ROSCH|nr:hypothetical protein RchiOBHm_Chr1g0337421 [Rosa chinensis]
MLTTTCIKISPILKALVFSGVDVVSSCCCPYLAVKKDPSC